MDAQALLRAGRLDEALASLQNQIRAQPGDQPLRLFLFQLLCVLGQWERALTQLAVLADMSAESLFMARLLEPVIRCELFRQEVFAGTRRPIIFGEPEEWMGLLLQTNELAAKGQFEAAAQCSRKAFEAAPATPGKINDQPFAWLADADPRLGAALELFLEGRYFWVPFCRIRSIVTEPPSDLRDLVWLPAKFVWANGGEANAFIPTRYPGTEALSDGDLRLARKTEWEQKAKGFASGLGQRLFMTEQADFPLLEARRVEFATATGAPS